MPQPLPAYRSSILASALLACLPRVLCAADSTTGAEAHLHLAPLPLTAGGATPWAFHPLWFALLALALPALCWTTLAWRRVLKEDPNLLRRRGLRELLHVQLRLSSSDVPSPLDLQAWLRAVARTWNVSVSAPTLQQLREGIRTASTTADDEAANLAGWEALWNAAEHRLYSAQANLTLTWVIDSTKAAQAVRIPRIKHWWPGKLRHWWPHLALGLWCCAALLVPGPAGHAEEAANLLTLEAQAAATLSAAQEPAGLALRSDWNNWAAHYNVGAQQMVTGNVDYAVAHLTAAFLQRPHSYVIRDNLRWSLQQAGTMNATLRRLLYGAWFQRYPSLLSPSGWQRLGLAASLLLGCGLSALVLTLYSHQHRKRLRPLGQIAIAGGLVLLASSVLAWNAWGNLTHPKVAMTVEEINMSPAPTDLVKDRETLPVVAGSLELTETSYLGWRRVRLLDVPGQVTGWMRTAYVMPLYAGN